jgi:hypothetical protein
LGKPKRNFHFHNQCTISKDHPRNLAELKQQKGTIE